MNLLDQPPLGNPNNVHTKHCLFAGKAEGTLIKSVCADNSSYAAVRDIDSVGGGLRKRV